jgi:peroxiredoxin
VNTRAALPLLALALLACGPTGPSGAPATSPSGQAARPPDFELPRLGGGNERLSAHFGKDVVLVDFWATFCKPCLRSMPDLDALYRARQERGFVVLGVSIDGPGSTADVQAAVSQLGVSFPILLDQESRVVALYNPRASAPFSVLIGRDGRVLAEREGYSTGSHDALERDVDAALGVVAP